MRPLRALRTAARSDWALPGLLALLASSVVAVNTLALPALAPDLVWGPRRPSPLAFTVSNRSPSLERQMRNLARSEVWWALNGADGLPDAERLAALREQRRLPRARGADEPPGAVVEVRAGTASGAPSAPAGVRILPLPATPPGAGRAAPNGRLGLPGPDGRPLWLSPAVEDPAAGPSFIVPLGLHRSGIAGIGLYCAALVSFGALAALAALLAPARLRVARDTLTAERPWRLFAVGALAYLLTGLLGLFLAMLVVSGPMAGMLFGAMTLVTAMGLITAALALGRALTHRFRPAPPNPAAELATGALALFTASILPFAGWPLAIFAGCCGLGSLIVTRFGSGEPWSLRPLE